MNLPNKLTVFRVILIVPFVVIMLTDFCGIFGKWIALGIFVIASLTDLLDGKLQENTILLPILESLWIP